MQKLRGILLVVTIAAVALGGGYLLNLINSNNSISQSSANVYNIVGLAQVEDNIFYPNNIVINVNSQILVDSKVSTATLEISFDKNLLSVEDIIMPSNIIALNQKVDSINSLITLEIQSTSSEGFKGVSNLAKLVFTKVDENGGKFTSINLLSTSTMGNPNTLAPEDTSVSISL